MNLRSEQRHRARQHNHALIRLRERFMPEAQMMDVIAIRDLAHDASKLIKALPFDSVKHVFVTYAGHRIHVVYSPLFNAVRTVLPAA
jgi:hypothetical protein